jgi:hypothetical protein
MYRYIYIYVYVFAFLHLLALLRVAGELVLGEHDFALPDLEPYRHLNI